MCQGHELRFCATFLCINTVLWWPVDSRQICGIAWAHPCQNKAGFSPRSTVDPQEPAASASRGLNEGLHSLAGQVFIFWDMVPLRGNSRTEHSWAKKSLFFWLWSLNMAWKGVGWTPCLVCVLGTTWPPNCSNSQGGKDDVVSPEHFLSMRSFSCPRLLVVLVAEGFPLQLSK